MASHVLNSTAQMYNWLMAKGDPRNSHWPLLGSPFPMLSIIFSYIYFVKVLGPQWMKSKKPYQIEGIIVAYNILMVILSAFFFFYGGGLTYLPPTGKYSFVCEPIDYSGSDESMQLVRLGWWFLILKISEFADTIFFVLRKKFNQISTLHVVHHSLVAWGVWVGLKFGGGGHNAFFPFINCGVHMIMYTYYCLSALGPNVRKYLWWKRYITMIQMVQFVIALVHACIPLFVECGYHPGFAYAIIGHAILFWVMFYNFYQKNYNTNQINNNSKSITSTIHEDESLCHQNGQITKIKSKNNANVDAITRKMCEESEVNNHMNAKKLN